MLGHMTEEQNEKLRRTKRNSSYQRYVNLMQKVINVLALASFAVSGAIVAGGAHVYLTKMQ